MKMINTQQRHHNGFIYHVEHKCRVVGEVFKQETIRLGQGTEKETHWYLFSRVSDVQFDEFEFDRLETVKAYLDQRFEVQRTERKERRKSMAGQAMKRAWAIRRETAKRLKCRVSEVVWGECLRLAWKEIKQSEKRAAWEMPKVSDLQLQIPQLVAPDVDADVLLESTKPLSLADVSKIWGL